MAKFYVAVITMFDEKGNLDFAANKGVYEHLIAGGSDGMVVLGSTGEFFSMTMEQAKEAAKFAVETVNHRMKVFVGTSRMRPEESVELSNYALEQGADGVMIISPYYFKLSDASIEAYYDAIVPRVKGKVYLYNFPGCTGYDLKPEIALRLRRKYSNIAGYKDTVPDMGHTRRLIQVMTDVFPDFEVYSGYDEFFIHNLMSGGAGSIGGLPNLAPEVFSKWARDFEAGDFPAVMETQKHVNRMMGFFEICNPFVTAVKYAMHKKGVIPSEYSYPPLVAASEEERRKVDRLMEELGM